MSGLIYSIIGLVIGGIISFLVGRYFFKKSQKSTSISCFVQYVSEILTDIDPEVKNEIEIKFKEQKVQNLYQVQFLIANSGDVPIKNLISPLTLNLLGKVLDANIIQIDPPGRKVNLIVNETKDKIEFEFPLLNSGDFFISKILVEGSPPPPTSFITDNNKLLISKQIIPNFTFGITADDLPPFINSEYLPQNFEDLSASKDQSYNMIVGGFIILFINFILVTILLNLDLLNSSYSLLNYNTFFHDFNTLKVIIILGWLTSIGLTFLNILIFISEVRKSKLRRKFYINVPSN